VILEYFEHIK